MKGSNFHKQHSSKEKQQFEKRERKNDSPLPQTQRVQFTKNGHSIKKVDSGLKIAFARALLTSKICYELFPEAIENKSPLDRALARVFRNNKQCGSADRRFISETLYALARWWGWVKQLVPTQYQTKWPLDSSTILDDQPLWVIPLIAARCLDGLALDLPGHIWCQKVKIEQIPEETWEVYPIEKRAVLFADMFHCEVPEITQLIPEWFLQEIPSYINLSKLIFWLQKRPPLWLRIQSENHDEVIQLLKDATLNPIIHSHLPNAVKVTNSKVNLYALSLYQKGAIEVQDLASQCVSIIADPKPGERWLDYCAGAGGKTLHLASLMKNKGTIIATDKRNWKLEDLRKRSRRAGLHNIWGKETEGEFPKVKNSNFDGVLVDAPCSCTGTWRRNPDARWSTEYEMVQELQKLQLLILSHACKAVKPDGTLVYATCSFNQMENENVVQLFMKEHPEFQLYPFLHPLNNQPIPTAQVRIWPYEGDCDSLFIARFKLINLSSP